MHLLPRIGVALLLTMVAACGYRAKKLSLTQADLVVPARTRMTNFMSAPMRPGSPSEQAPPSISRSVLADEAMISRVSDAELCIDATFRTEVSLDVPLSEYEVSLNETPITLVEQNVAQREYTFQGERDIMTASHVSRHAAGEFRWTQPVEKSFRVVERTGRGCMRLAGRVPPELHLKVVLGQDDRRGNWGETFSWMFR